MIILNKKLVNLSLIMLLVVIFSCDNKNYKKDKNILECTEIIASDSLGYVRDFLKVKNNIVLLDAKPLNNDNQIRVYDANNFKFLYSLGRVGSGPGEFRQGMSMNRVNSKHGGFSLLDLTGYKVLFFENSNNGKMNFSHMIQLKGGRPYMPVSTGSTDIYSLCLEIFEGRFAHYDRLGNKIKTLGEIPPGKKDDTPVPVHQQASKGIIRITPDSSKLVVSYQFADMIDIYDLNGNLLKRIIGDEGKTPIYKSEIRNGYPTMLLDFNNCIYGFLDIEVTNNYIVALYSGKILNETEYESDILHIYTFDGKLKDVYQLNTKVSSIVLDTENKRLLASAIYPEPKIFSFELSL